MKTSTLIFLFSLACASLLHAEPLTQSTFTELVRNVDVLTGPDKTAQPAKLNEVFHSPNLVRTGPNSRAELTAPDDTITRVGANTIFSFAPSGREINLEQGSVLFHSPTGKGGGVIKSGGASAAVTGTTLIVSTVPGEKPDNNGFKVILLEGKGLVKLKNGSFRELKAGQLIYILPNHAGFGPLLYINLAKMVGGSALVHGFSQNLSSTPQINNAINKQHELLAKGKVWDTGRRADRFVTDPLPPGGGSHNGPNNGDPNTFQYSIYNTTLQSIANGNPPTGSTPTVPGLPLIVYPIVYTSGFGTTGTSTGYTYNPATAAAVEKNNQNLYSGGGGTLGSYNSSSSTGSIDYSSGSYSKSGQTTYINPDALSAGKSALATAAANKISRVAPSTFVK